MREEDVVGDIYGTRDLYDFNVSVHNDLTTEELRDLLESGTDFLHYIGHVTDEGIMCTDGMLDVGELDECGVRGFFLNGCRSYEQGEKLVEKGSRVGVVTLAKIGNEPATEVGTELARLLNHGFSMQGALSVVTDVSVLDRQYVIVGDGSQELVETRCGTPVVIEPERGTDLISTEVHPCPTVSSPIGTLMTTKIKEKKIHSLNSTILKEDLDSDSLDEFFGYSTNPIRLNNKIYWTDEITSEDI